MASGAAGHAADRYALVSSCCAVGAMALALVPIPWVAVYGAHLMWPSFLVALVGFVYAARVWPPGATGAGPMRALCIVGNLFAMGLALMVGSWFGQGAA